MCTPIAFAGAALSIGSQAAGLVGQSQAVNASNRFQMDRYRTVTTAALESYVSQTRDVQRRFVEESEAAAQSGLNNAREADQARGRGRVSAGARGVSGTSVNEMLDNYSRIEAENEFTIQRNMEMFTAQTASQLEGLRAQAQGRINGAYPQLQAGPSPLAFGIGLGSSIFNGFNTAGELGYGPFSRYYQ